MPTKQLLRTLHVLGLKHHRQTGPADSPRCSPPPPASRPFKVALPKGGGGCQLTLNGHSEDLTRGYVIISLLSSLSN